MTANFNDILDRAIEQHLAGESFRETPDQTPAQREALDELLATASILKTLTPVEHPDPDALWADRNEFLHQLRAMSSSLAPAGVWPRLRDWAVHHLSWQLPDVSNQRKGYGPMSSMMIKLTLIFAVIFGSVGGTAVMAAESLPDSPLYPLKLSMEQAQLAMTAAPADQAALHLEFAQMRLSEMRQLTASGNTPDEAAMTQTMARLEQNFKMTLQLGAQLSDDAQQGLLTQTREMVQTQVRLQAQAEAQSSEPAQYALQQATRLLNQVGQEVEAGLHRYGPDDAPPPPCEGEDCPQNRERVQEPAKNADCDTDDCTGAENRQQNRQQQANEDCDNNPDCAGDQLQQQTQTRSQMQAQDCDEDATCVENRERARMRGQDGGISGVNQPETVEPDQTRDRIKDCDPASEGCDGVPDQDQDQTRDRTGDCTSGSAECDGVPDQDRLRDGQGGNADQTETPDQDQDQDQTGDCDTGCDGVPDQIQDRDQDQDGSGNGVQDGNREQTGQNDEVDQNQPANPAEPAPVENENSGSDNQNSGGSSDSGGGSSSNSGGSSDSGGSSSSSGGGSSGKGGK